MMTTDKLYLFDALQPILQEKDIQFDFFSQMYDEVSMTSAPEIRINEDEYSDNHSFLDSSEERNIRDGL